MRRLLGAALVAAAVEELAGAATDASPSAPHVMRQIVERSGGNPLFLQELVAAARELDGVDTLPGSIESLVTARIDRLPSASRTVLREASVLGYSFSRELAAAVLTSGDPTELEALPDFLSVARAVRYDQAREILGAPIARGQEVGAGSTALEAEARMAEVEHGFAVVAEPHAQDAERAALRAASAATLETLGIATFPYPPALAPGV